MAAAWDKLENGDLVERLYVLKDEFIQRDISDGQKQALYQAVLWLTRSKDSRNFRPQHQELDT